MTTKPETITVNVTARDIAEGVRFHVRKCPLGRAISRKRAIKGAIVGPPSIGRSDAPWSAEICFEDDPYYSYCYALSGDAVRFAKAFDSSVGYPPGSSVSPGRFTLHRTSEHGIPAI